MGRQGLIILVVAERDPLIIERSQSAIENFESVEFFFLRDDQPRKKKQPNKRSEVSARHELEALFAEGALRDQINGEAAEPVAAFVMCSGHRGQSRATMS